MLMEVFGSTLLSETLGDFWNPREMRCTVEMQPLC